MSELTPLTDEALNTLRGDFAQSGTNRLAMNAVTAAGIDKAQVIVAALDDPDANLRLVRYAKEKRPDITVIARARDRSSASSAWPRAPGSSPSAIRPCQAGVAAAFWT